MKAKLFCKYVLISACLLCLSLTACQGAQAGVVSTETPSAPTAENAAVELPSTSVEPLPVETIEVVFINDGNIQVWDEATGQVRTLVNTGDVFSLTTSDDGQVVAYTRVSWSGDVSDGYEQCALWAVNRDGGNQRELISAQDFRQWMDASERYSSNFLQQSWIPQSHQLIVSGTTYIVQAEGLSHAVPQGAYLVDVDGGSVTVLAEAAEHLHFVPSPDGKQIALLSPTSVGFINVDGSNRRQDVLTFAEAGLTGPLFPVGVWSEDSQAFVTTGSLEKDADYNIYFRMWRIPMDGSSPEALSDVLTSMPQSVSFSPDGKKVSYIQFADLNVWSIKALNPEAGLLALPYYGVGTSYANLHWSPAGDAYAIKGQDLVRLCADATQDAQVCGDPIHLGSGIIVKLQWVDSARFLFESSEPYRLSLGSVDGTITPIVTWTEGHRWTEKDVMAGWAVSW
jgi:WD40 repeat protein